MFIFFKSPLLFDSLKIFFVSTLPFLLTLSTKLAYLFEVVQRIISCLALIHISGTTEKSFIRDQSEVLKKAGQTPPSSRHRIPSFSFLSSFPFHLFKSFQP